MIQTRNMKKNNITMNDIQIRDFHIKNYENIKQWKTVPTYKNNLAKEKINYIFNSFIREIDFGPFYFQVRSNRYKNTNICDSITNSPFYPGGDDGEKRECPVNLIICRYESKRDKIKQEIRKDCQYCADAW